MFCAYGPPVFGLMCQQDMHLRVAGVFDSDPSDLTTALVPVGLRARRSSTGTSTGLAAGNMKRLECYILHEPARSPTAVVNGSQVVQAFYQTPPAMIEAAFKFKILEVRTRDYIRKAGSGVTVAGTISENTTSGTLGANSTVDADAAPSTSFQVRVELIVGGVAVFLLILFLVVVIAQMHRTKRRLIAKEAPQGLPGKEFALVADTLAGHGHGPSPPTAFEYDAGQDGEERWSALDNDAVQWDSITAVVAAKNATNTQHQRLNTNTAYSALGRQKPLSLDQQRSLLAARTTSLKGTNPLQNAGGAHSQNDWDLVSDVLQQSQELDAIMMNSPHDAGDEWDVVMKVLHGGGEDAPQPLRSPVYVTVDDYNGSDSDSEENEELRMYSPEPRCGSNELDDDVDGRATAWSPQTIDGRATAWSQAERPPTAWSGACFKRAWFKRTPTHLGLVSVLGSNTM